ncbi:MAG: Fe-S protein assembly co-chaperone HscB [Gammaproteobacteria bacterium]|nr:Fe-S protein assembly co-chaperone HscB [Gammaproteobacteria bacterium]MDH5800917.1 Fe-S protein assembly co-chaperone HscB [Gammaproteobacteria bacterium]
MTTVNLTSNYFELFELPVSYDVNLQDLSERFRRLQSIVHPDNFANKGDAERRLSVQQSALINEAYQTLRGPLSRAIYMLGLAGCDVLHDTATSMDQGFLMQQMELRESLAAISSAADPVGELLDFNKGLDQLLTQVLEQLRPLMKSLGSLQEQLQHSKDLVKRLQFISKLQQESRELEEQLL